MKCMFNPKNRISSTLNAEEKKQHLFYTILSVLLLVAGSVVFFEFLYEFCNMVGCCVSGMPSEAIKELRRMLPLQLTAIFLVYAACWTFNAYRTDSKEKRARIFKRHGFISVVIGCIIALYVVIGRFTGQYYSFVEGFPSALFPLDTAIGGLLIMMMGFFSIGYSKIIKKSEVFVSCGVKGGFKMFHTISYMIGIQSLMCCVYGIFYMDWAHGMVAYNIILLLNYFTAFLMAVCYRFGYSEMRPEYKKDKELGLGITFLVLNTVLFALYILLGNKYNEAPNLNAYAILPIEFTSSFNAFLVLMGLNNIVTPLVATQKGLIGRKK